MTSNRFDLIIVGTGPAGVTAAIYSQRMGLNTVVLGDIPGGSVYMIESIMNLPGFLGGVPGTQFGAIAFQQAQSEGAEFPMSRLERLSESEGVFTGVDAESREYTTPAAVVATGRVPKRLPVANAHLKGAHFCSICDGPLYRGKQATLAVIGSDNPAAQHALALSRVAAKVLLICRSDALKMDPFHRHQLEGLENVDILAATEVTAYQGLDAVESLVVVSKGDNQREIAVDGLFLAIGWKPNTQMLEMTVSKTDEGYLSTDHTLMTSVPGLFAAGDVRDTDLAQVLTACADGARAAKHAADYLKNR